jgi:integrase
VASITKRTGARGVTYLVRYRTPAGEPRKETFKTATAAKRRARAVEVDKDRGGFVDPRDARVKFEKYATEWLGTRPNLRPRTRETYQSQLAHIMPRFARVELGKIKPSMVRSWHAELSNELGANTVAKCYRLLRSILKTAVDDELLVRNPCKIEGGGVEYADERPVASIEQVWSLADAMPDRYRLLVVLSGFTGLRIGELLGLERRHVNPLHRTLRVEQQQQELNSGKLLIGSPKTPAGVRTLGLPAFLMPEIETHMANWSAPGTGGRVFPGERGGALREWTVYKHWNRARTKVEGLPEGFRFHDLRHTANTMTAAAGASTRELMSRMGHASSAAALRYQHATSERDAEIARLLDARVTGARPERAQDAADVAD